jgi:hypothetical protein
MSFWDFACTHPGPVAFVTTLMLLVIGHSVSRICDVFEARLKRPAPRNPNFPAQPMWFSKTTETTEKPTQNEKELPHAE